MWSNARLPAWRHAALHAAYFATLAVFLFPILWVVSLSMKTGQEVFAWPPTALPRAFDLSNYVYVWRQTQVPHSLLNSLRITIASVAGCLAAATPAAYAFSRLRFRGRRALLLALLVFQMISPLVIAIPLYRYYQALHLLDTHLGVILVYVTVEIPFTVWLLKGFFDGIPPALDEAARIDGCTRAQSLRLVLLPLALPGIAAAVVFNVIAAWSQFVLPFILLSRSELYPISVSVLYFQQAQSDGDVSIPYLAAASIIAMLPAMLAFILLQRFIVQVLVGGAVKG